jgi:hypothetical protein
VVIQQLDLTSNHNPVGTPEIVNVTSTSNGCTTTSNATTCTLSFAAPAGTFDFSVKTYSATNGGGSLLSENTLSTLTVLVGQDNPITVTLNGVLASVISTASISMKVGTTLPLPFTPQDASGATIIGPGTYDNGPLTIAGAPASITVTPPSFNGPGDGMSANLHCTQPANGSLQFNDSSGTLGGPVSISCTADSIALSAGSMDFSAVAASSSDGTYDQPLTAADPNVGAILSWNLNCTPSGVVSIVGGGPSVNIRPLNVGTCTLYAGDQYGAKSPTINIEVHTTTITIQSRQAH